MKSPFHDLKDIKDVTPIGDGDNECLGELRDVLRKYGMIDRFGISLLHKHFPVYADETLVEFCNPKKRELVFRALNSDRRPKGRVIQTSWRFNAEGAALYQCLMDCVVDDEGDHSYEHTDDGDDDD